MTVKINEPIGEALWAPLFLRIGIGGYFVMAGLVKIDHIDAFVQQVKTFGILPNAGAMAYASLLPYLEIGAGALILIGFWTTLGAILASVLLCSFIVAIGVFPYKAIPLAGHLFNKDLILLCGTLSLLYSGAGAYSLDRFRKSG